MKKKILSVAVAGIMLAGGMSAFAGCGTIAIKPIDWTVDLSKPVELSGLYPVTGIGAFGKDDTAKIIENTTGYKVKYTELGSNADSDVSKYLSNRTKYDFMKLTEAQYHPYLPTGTFCDLTEILQSTEAGRTLYQLIDLMEYGWEAATYVDPEDGSKHIYGVPDFGYVSMIDSAMVWNKNHLEQVGFYEQYPDTENGMPETMEQVDWALHACQDKFGSNDRYHALGIPGSNSVEITQLKGAFEVPFQFYYDEDPDSPTYHTIQQYVYSPNTMNYAVYMNGLRQAGILSSKWQDEQAAGLYTKFADGYYSCAFVSYWCFAPLVEAAQKRAKIAEDAGIENTVDALKAEVIGCQLRVRGDGTHGTKVQERARLEGGGAGVSYYTVIPAYMADRALYVVDFLAKKMEHFADYYGGSEGLHWNVLTGDDIPKGAPTAEEYTEERDDEYTKYEDFQNMVVFLRPYEFSYIKYTNTEEVADNKLVEATMKQEKVTVNQPGRWVKLTDRYVQQINDNSQYCNGTNAISARVLFHLRETGFNAWIVATYTDESTILNPMAMCPPMSEWVSVSILCRTLLKNGICSAIDAKNPETTLNDAREGAKKKSTGMGANRHYYWSDAISQEMTKWYTEVKLNRN